jgi:uncharacterized protein (TIGR02145 family)
LVGLTVEQIQNGEYDNEMYRLPTNAENAAAGYAISGTRPGSLTANTSYGVMVGNDATTFLPASGHRNSQTAAPFENGRFGYYWSSKANDSAGGWAAEFDTAYRTLAHKDQRGMAVRCVLQ